MSSAPGAKRTEDKLNLIGIVAVGLSSSVFVYVSIVLLQAFYMNETATVSTTADFRGQENPQKTLRAAHLTHIGEYGRNAGGPDQPETYRIPIDTALAIVVSEAKRDPSNLVPVVGKSVTPSIKAVFGRPQPLQAAAPAAGPGAPSAPADGTAPGAAAPGAPADGTVPATGTPPPATQTTRSPESTAPSGLVPPVRTESSPPGASASDSTAPAAAPAVAPAPARRPAPAPARRPARTPAGAQPGNAP